MKLEAEIELNRNPKDYEPSTHLLQRIRDRPLIDSDVVAKVIEDGSIEEVNDDGVTLRDDWLQATFEVVVAPKNEVIQTAYEVTES